MVFIKSDNDIKSVSMRVPDACHSFIAALLRKHPMASQHMTSNQQTSDLHLDVHLNAIREEFNRLKRELDEARNQRDELRRKCMIRVKNLLVKPLIQRLIDTKELQELQQTVFGTSNDRIVCQRCKSCRSTNDNLSPILSPVSSSGDYFSIHDEESEFDLPYESREVQRSLGGHGDNQGESYTSDEGEIPNDSTIPGNNLQSNVSPVKQPEDPDSTWKVKFNPDAKVALKLNLVRTVTQNTARTYAAFSMDGKYLATISETGVVHIFDMKTGMYR